MEEDAFFKTEVSGKIAAGSGNHCSGFLWPPHVLFQNFHQSIGALFYVGSANGIPRDRNKSIRVPGYIDFKPKSAIIDVVPFLVIGGNSGSEQNAYSLAGGTVFGITVHPGHDFLRHLRERPVCHTVVDVDCTDVIEYPDADAVISGHVADCRMEIGECSAVCGISPETADLIRHFGGIAVTLFIFPEAERSSLFQCLWQLFVHICFHPF